MSTLCIPRIPCIPKPLSSANEGYTRIHAEPSPAPTPGMEPRMSSLAAKRATEVADLLGKLAAVPNVDTWRQWAYVWDATPGDHTLSVRATDSGGYSQTGEEQGVVPDGATGWHTIGVSVS